MRSEIVVELFLLAGRGSKIDLRSRAEVAAFHRSARRHAAAEDDALGRVEKDIAGGILAQVFLEVKL